MFVLNITPIIVSYFLPFSWIIFYSSHYMLDVGCIFPQHIDLKCLLGKEKPWLCVALDYFCNQNCMFSFKWPFLLFIVKLPLHHIKPQLLFKIKCMFSHRDQSSDCPKLLLLLSTWFPFFWIWSLRVLFNEVYFWINGKYNVFIIHILIFI